MNNEKRLKIAIQKSGRLADISLQLLEKCGIFLAKSRDQLLCRAQNLPLDIFLVRDDDIPAFLATDVCQLGILGQNVLLEKQAQSNGIFSSLEQLLPIGHGKCRLSIAVPHGFKYDSIASLNGKVIATSYKGLLGQYLATHNIKADIVTMEGAVEVADAQVGVGRPPRHTRGCPRAYSRLAAARARQEEKEQKGQGCWPAAAAAAADACHSAAARRRRFDAAHAGNRTGWYGPGSGAAGAVARWPCAG